MDALRVQASIFAVFFFYAKACFTELPRLQFFTYHHQSIAK